MTLKTRKRKNRLAEDLAHCIENLGLTSKDDQINVVTLPLKKLGLLENNSKFFCKATKNSRTLTYIETRKHAWNV